MDERLQGGIGCCEKYRIRSGKLHLFAWRICRHLTNLLVVLGSYQWFICARRTQSTTWRYEDIRLWSIQRNGRHPSVYPDQGDHDARTPCAPYCCSQVKLDWEIRRVSRCLKCKYREYMLYSSMWTTIITLTIDEGSRVTHQKDAGG
jgi:hypothetical protein